MAVTLLDTPYPVMAAHNSCYYKMTSDNLAFPGFRYVIETTIDDGFGSVYTQEYEIIPVPNEDGYYDASPITSLLPLQRLENTIYGTNGFEITKRATVTVRFGEFWSGVFHGYDASHTFQVWNASKTVVQMYNKKPEYAYTFYYGSPQTVIESMMSNLADEKVYETTSTYLSIFNSSVLNNFVGFTFKVYNLNGTLISQSRKNNPYWNQSNYKNNLVYLDVGIPSLRAMTPSSGTSPILPSGINFYYEVWFDYQNTPQGIVYSEKIKTYYPTCEPVYKLQTFHYLSRLGAWDTCVFAKNSTETLNKTSENFGQFLREEKDVLTPSLYKNPIYSTMIERTMNITTQKTINVNTGWLSEEEVRKYQDLFDSPQIYTELYLGDSNVMLTVLSVANSYKLNKRYNKKRYQLNMSFKFATQENRQR